MLSVSNEDLHCEETWAPRRLRKLSNELLRGMTLNSVSPEMLMIGLP